MTEEQAINKIRNPVWRLSHLYKIQTKDSRLIPFKPNMAQIDYLNSRTGRDILLKARQLGFTTACCISMLDNTLTNKHTSSAIIAHKREKVTIIFEIVKRAFDYMPPMLKPVVKYDNRNELYFPELDSKIFVTLDTRGETIHNLHMSEVAFMEKAETSMTGILESVPKTGRITLESTANGAAGYFHDEWENQLSEFTKHFYNWLWDEDYMATTDLSMEELEAEYKEHVFRYGLIPNIVERYQLTKEQFYFYILKIRRHKHLVMQEYPLNALEAFISSGRNVFHISDLQKHITKQPIKKRWVDIDIYEEPMKDFRYVIGCDVAEGLGGDYSVIEVFNAETGEQAAEFVSNAVAPDRLADYLIDLGRYYNRAWINVEVNNHGRTTIDHLKRRYLNIYRRKVFDHVTNENTEALGWRTTHTSKATLIDNLEEAVREMGLHIRSQNVIREMKTYVQTDEPGKQGFGAEGSAHDDTVIACGLALQMIKDLPRQKKPMTIAEQKLREYIKKHGLPTNFAEPVINQPTHREMRYNYAKTR